MLPEKSVICPIIIGREPDLNLLDRLISQTRAKQGQVVLVSGEAGIGKSRLAMEAVTRFPQESTSIGGFCYQNESALPYAPLLDLLRNFLTLHSREEVVEYLGSIAPQLVKMLPELISYFPNTVPVQSMEPKQEKQRLFQALIQTFVELARFQPLLIIIEDIHWSDSTSLEFLLLLARRIQSLPILLLLTYRSDETTPELTHFLAELDRARLGTEMELRQLGPTDVKVMLQAILEPNTPINNDFLDLILPLTEGNPFFIEEILKALISDGSIFYEDGKWDRKEINQLHIPRTVQSAIDRRTQQLNELDFTALTMAAVMGRKFDFDLLQLLMGLNESELTMILKELVKAQLVAEESVNQFVFRHALTREAIYSKLLLRERQNLHRMVAEAIEQLHADALNARFADLSYHYYTGGLWDKALEYSQQAGDQARDLYAQHESIIYYSRVLVCARELKIKISPQLLSARGHAYEILGDFKSALDDFEQALHIAQVEQNGTAEWQTLIDIGFLWAGRDYQQTGAYFRAAEIHAKKLDDRKMHAQSLNRLGNWHVNVGEIEKGLKIHLQALAILEDANDERGMAETYDLLGMATLQRGDQVGSYNEYQHAIRLFRKLDDKQGLISALTVASTTTCWDETDQIPVNIVAENQILGMEALDLARKIDWMAGQAFAEWCLALNLTNQGIFEQAMTHGRDALQTATDIDHRQWIIGAQYALGCNYLLMLQADLAIQHLEHGLSLAKELGSAWWIGNLSASLANSYLLNMDLSRARSVLESIFPKDKISYALVERRMLLAKGNLLLAENKPTQALEISKLLHDAVGNKSQPKPIPAVLKLKGEAETVLKRWKPAKRDLEQAKQAAAQRQALPLLWQIHRSLARLYKSQRDREGMDREIKSARQILQQLETNITDEKLRADFIHSADKSLPVESKISKRRSAAKKFDGLTPREQEVARLISEGKSNRKVAEELVLSERTVENHVGNILTKLGYNSRAQVAVWAMEKGLGKHQEGS